MLYALAYSEDVRMRCLHVVIHDNAVVHLEAGFPSQFHIGTDAGGNYDQLRFDAAAIFEGYGFNLAVAEEGGCRVAQQHLNSHPLHLFFEIAAADKVQLPLHERIHQVHNGHITALHLKSARGFESKQAAANHDSFDSRTRTLQQGAGVIQIAEDEDVILLNPFDGWNKRRAAGGDQQLVKGSNAAIISRDCLGHGINIRNTNTQLQPDTVLLIPFEPVQRDVIERFLTCQHGREQNAVVVDVGLISKNSDFEFRRVFKNLFHAGHAGHAISNDDKLLHARTSDCMAVTHKPSDFAMEPIFHTGSTLRPIKHLLQRGFAPICGSRRCLLV